MMISSDRTCFRILKNQVHQTEILEFIQKYFDFYQDSNILPQTLKKFGESEMICYKKLWKRMIDCELNKTQLREKAGVSTNAIAKLGKGENVSMDVLVKICKALHCDISDVINWRACVIEKIPCWSLNLRIRLSSEKI